ncbi:MAG: spermidine synthase, partial [Xanthobacteraceae bacterium]
MSLDFEELHYRPTPIGALSLRRRRELKLGMDVFEIKLGDEFLMSSLFTASEIALARLGLAGLSEPGLDVVVGRTCQHHRSLDLPIRDVPVGFEEHSLARRRNQLEAVPLVEADRPI